MNGTSARTPRQRLEDLITQGAADPTPVFEVGIPMRDGVELAADIYLPVESARPAPAIVQSTPYDKRNPLLFLSEARFFQNQGYAFVIHDLPRLRIHRGSGYRSREGQWRDAPRKREGKIRSTDGAIAYFHFSSAL